MPYLSLNGVKSSGAIHCLEREPISQRIRNTATEATPRQNAGFESIFFNALSFLERREELGGHPLPGARADLPEDQEHRDRGHAAPERGVRKHFFQCPILP